MNTPMIQLSAWDWMRMPAAVLRCTFRRFFAKKPTPPVKLSTAWDNPVRHTSELVGDYSDADRRLWLAVSLGFESLVQLALKAGGDAAKTYRMQDGEGREFEVDLLMLAWLRTPGDRLSIFRTNLREAGLGALDPVTRWGFGNDEDEIQRYEEGAVTSEHVDGDAVARALIEAGADPYRSFRFIRHREQTFPPLWTAADAVPAWGVLARSRMLDQQLPQATVTPTKPKRF